MTSLGRADAARATGSGWIEDEVLAQLEHEFRTPLAAIRAIGEILRDVPELQAPERRALLDALLVEQDRLARTLEVLLEELGAR
mgnify:FL=1